MEELIFFAVIIFFSIIDSIARSRKKKQGDASGAPVPKRRERQRSVPRYDTEATHDAQPTYETERTFEVQETYDADSSYDEGPSYEDDIKEETGSEGMIPADLWEEIAGLAQGRKLPRPLPAPLPPPVLVSRGPDRPVETHRVHLTHQGYGTDPSSRARSEQDGMDPLAVHENADSLAIRRQLRREGAHSLRQAVILHEVLGPPVALRPDGFER